jgi:hypothetical protein
MRTDEEILLLYRNDKYYKLTLEEQFRLGKLKPDKKHPQKQLKDY